MEITMSNLSVYLSKNLLIARMKITRKSQPNKRISTQRSMIEYKEHAVMTQGHEAGISITNYG